MNGYLRIACSPEHMCKDPVCNLKSTTDPLFSSKDVILSVSPSPLLNNVVSTSERSSNVEEPENSTRGHDVDTDFDVWKERFEHARKQEQKP